MCRNCSCRTSARSPPKARTGAAALRPAAGGFPQPSAPGGGGPVAWDVAHAGMEVIQTVEVAPGTAAQHTAATVAPPAAVRPLRHVPDHVRQTRAVGTVRADRARSKVLYPLPPKVASGLRTRSRTLPLRLRRQPIPCVRRTLSHDTYACASSTGAWSTRPTSATRCILVRRAPLACQPLRLGDLRGAHPRLQQVERAAVVLVIL